MKLFFTLLLVTGVITGCRNQASEKQEPTAGKDSLQNSSITGSAILIPERERLITALQQLQQHMANRNKEAIAAYFRFPVDNDVLQLFDVDAAFDKQLEQNNHALSRELFFSYFDKIYDNLEMQGFAGLFKNVQLTKLKDTTQKQVESRVADGVCAHFYNITIEGREVTLQYGVYTNEEHTAANSNAAAECPEYAAFWTFIFDGEKLVFDRHQVAG